MATVGATAAARAASTSVSFTRKPYTFTIAPAHARGLAASQTADEVPRAVHPGAVNGVGHEPLRRLGGVAIVAARPLRVAGAELAADADGQQGPAEARLED
eukprot:8266177-Lingulodinium_polyedra.AAC.1